MLAGGIGKTRDDFPPGAALDKALGFAADRDYANALRHFEEALHEGPPFAARCGQALCLYKMGRLREALLSAQRASKGSPRRSEPHFISGLVLKDTGRYDLAIESLDRAMELGFDRTAGLYHRGAAHFLAGRLEAAESDFKEVTVLLPESAAAFYNLGVTRVHRSRWPEAAQALSTCARLDPAGAAYYHQMLFGLGRAQAGEEFHFRGHRIKNMLALLADTYHRRLEDSRQSLPSSRADEVSERFETVLAEMSELLSFVRQEPLELDVWDIHDIIETALLQASEALLKVSVAKRFAADIPGVVCDADSLNEAFLNLILNASEAMPEGGRLTITTDWGENSSVKVAFEDTGGGVKADPPERVFQFAFTTKRGGTGLGLCQASRAVGEHGGRISVAQGKLGAEFVVVLPLTARIGERIQDIGLRPDLSDDVALCLLKGPDVTLEARVGR